jgi:hypothetical protein
MQDKAGVTLDRREMLRVKVKSLAAEAAIIRKEERRLRGPLRSELREHRVGAVRSEARLSHLAYNFVRGRKLQIAEPKRRPDNELVANDWKRIFEMFVRYGALRLKVDRKAAENAFVELQGVVPKSEPESRTDRDQRAADHRAAAAPGQA